MFGPLLALMLGMHTPDASASHGAAINRLKIPTLCVAHRGNSWVELENSLAALRSAVKLGAPVVEFDIHHTKDGVAILMHDSTLERTATNRPGKSCPLSAEIATLDFEMIRSSCLLKNGEEIPSLKETLQELSKTRTGVFLELKDRPSPSTMKTLAEIYRGDPSALRVIAFDDKTLETVRQKLPPALFKGGAKLFHVSGEEARTNTSFDGVTVKQPSAKFVRRLQSQGLEVGAWTIDDAPQIKAYLAMGINYITTNQPGLCLSLAKSLSEPEPSCAP